MTQNPNQETQETTRTTPSNPPPAQPGRLGRPMSSDEAHIVDQLAKFPKDARSLKDKKEVERRSICRHLAKALRDGVLQVMHIDTLKERQDALADARAQLNDANLLMSILAKNGPLVFTEQQFVEFDRNTELILTKDPEARTITISLRKREVPAAPEATG